MNRFIFLFFLLLYLPMVNAQIPKIKWGEISPEEQAYNQVIFDPEADAVILDEKGFLSITGGSYSLKVTRRIKILSEKGLNQANLELAYYADKGFESIGSIKAQTLNEVEGKTVVSRVESKNIFDLKVNELYNVKRLTFPNVKVGSIIEFQYQLHSQLIDVIDAWDFQHEIPTVQSQFELDIQGNLDYNSLLIGTSLVKKYSHQKNTKSFVLQEIPSFNALHFTYNKKNTSDRLKLQLKGYLTPNGYKSAIGSWKDLSKELIFNYSKYANPIAIKTLAQKIPNGSTELESLENVIRYFAHTFRFNGIKGIYTTKAQKKIIDDQYGSVADLNHVLHEVLKVKKIDTDLILLSSRLHGKIMTSFPYLRQFDYVVNLVRLKDQSTYIVDATAINGSQYKFAPLYLFNDYGYLLTSSKQDFIQLNQFTSVYEAHFSYVHINNMVQQERKDAFNGYFYEPDHYQKAISNSYLNQPITLVFDELDKPEKSFDQHQYTMIQTGVNKQDQTIITLINPLKDFIKEFDFKEDNRMAPIEFNFPFSFLVHVDINIPSDYELIQPSEFEKVIRISEDLIYHQKFVASTTQLKILYQFYLGKAIFDAKDYGQLKRAFEEINQNAQKEFILKMHKVN